MTEYWESQAWWSEGGPSMDWMDQAGCRHYPTLPWTMDGPAILPISEAAMKRVCDACPVRARCRKFVEAAQICGGFWAGRWRSDLDARSARKDEEAA